MFSFFSVCVATSLLRISHGEPAWFLSPQTQPGLPSDPFGARFPPVQQPQLSLSPQPQLGISQLQLQCPPLAQCLGEDLLTLDNLCSSFSAVVVSMWHCVDFGTLSHLNKSPSSSSPFHANRHQLLDELNPSGNIDRLDELLVWRQEQAGQQCWKFANEYPEVRDILRCHNIFYTSMHDVYRQSCIVEQKFFECMGWPIAGQMDCNNVRTSPDLLSARSSMIYDLQLPQKKSVTTAQNVCMRGRLAKQKQCYQTNIGKCPNAGVRQQFLPPPLIESRLETCLKQKAQREAELTTRAEAQLDQIHQNQKVCLDESEMKLYKRLYQKLLFSVFDADVKNATDANESFEQSKLRDDQKTLPTFNLVRFLRSVAGIAAKRGDH